MGPLNTILHKVNSWNNPETGFVKREIFSRATNLTITLPAEITAVAQNVLQTAVYTASTALKLLAKTASYLSGSEAIKNFEAKLPGFKDILGAISRVVAYSFGVLLTATVGLAHPATNFKWHCNLGLARKLQEEVRTFVEEAISFVTPVAEKNIIETLPTANALINETPVSMDEILKNEVQNDDLKKAFEVFKKEFEEECNSLNLTNEADSVAPNALPVEPENPVVEKDELKEEPVQIQQQEQVITAVKKQKAKKEVQSEDPAEVHKLVNQTFDNFFGKGMYHYDQTTGMVVQKTSAEKTQEFITNKLDNTWNRVPNIREKVSGLKNINIRESMTGLRNTNIREKMSNIWEKMPDIRGRLPDFRAMIPTFRAKKAN